MVQVAAFVDASRCAFLDVGGDEEVDGVLVSAEGAGRGPALSGQQAAQLCLFSADVDLREHVKVAEVRIGWGLPRGQ
ncbi:MAG: hypothetical protein ACRDR6_28090 [Pseudonocardiaceae bacterium]